MITVRIKKFELISSKYFGRNNQQLKKPHNDWLKLSGNDFAWFKPQLNLVKIIWWKWLNRIIKIKEILLSHVKMSEIGRKFQWMIITWLQSRYGGSILVEITRIKEMIIFHVTMIKWICPFFQYWPVLF